MKVKKIEEKHVTILPEVHLKLQELAKKEHRTMRAVVTRLIEKEHEK
jgi:hypothetical protein